jgi:transcription elongation factor GreA
MQVPIRKPDRYTHQKSDPRLTPAKLVEFQEKLKRLKLQRPRLAEEVKRLSETGDFSENAGYQTAKARLRGMNQRILELEEQIAHAEIITPADDVSCVQLGHRVTVEINGTQATYQILGSSETDPGRGIISHNSPIGSALIGHRVNDVVTFRSAAKTIECRVVRIE